MIARILEQELLNGPLSGASADADNARATLVNTADRVGEAPLDHPWAGALVVYDFDGVQEGIAQAPMPAPQRALPPDQRRATLRPALR